jgi:hypothetical protein
MTKPIAATPIARGEDARRIQDQLRSEKPLTTARVQALRDAVKTGKSSFTFVKSSSARGKP